MMHVLLYTPGDREDMLIFEVSGDVESGRVFGDGVEAIRLKPRVMRPGAVRCVGDNIALYVSSVQFTEITQYTSVLASTHTKLSGVCVACARAVRMKVCFDVRCITIKQRPTPVMSHVLMSS